MSLLGTCSWRRMGFWLVPALALLFLMPALDRQVARRQQELRVLITARDMAEGGSWILPHFRGELRFRKPPLMYWLTATSFRVARTTESLMAARLPSALAGFAFVGIVYFAGRALMGRRRALLSSLVCLSSFIFIRQARLAETDIALTLFTTMAIVFGYLALLHPTRRRWWTLAGLSAGLGFLIKGPAALALPLLTLVWFAATKPRRLRALFSPGAMLSAVLFIALAAPWYIIITHNKAAAAQLHFEIDRTFVESHHNGPWYYYFYTLLQAFAPWGLLLPVAVVAILRSVRNHHRLRFVLVWFLTGFISLSAISSKQIHYCTLLLAPSSLLMGWLLGFADVRARNWRRLVPIFYVRALIIVVAIASAALPLALRWSANPPLLPAFVFAFIAGVFCIWAWGTRPVLPRVFLLVTAMCSWALFAYGWGFPLYDKHSTIEDVAVAAKEHIESDAHVFSVGKEGAIIEFYAHHRLLDATNLPSAWAAAKPGDVIIVAGRADSAEAHETVPVPALATSQKADLFCAAYQKPAAPP